MSTVAAASMFGRSGLARAEPAPEVKKIRLVNVAVTCIAPLYVAEELLRLEGFSDVEYVERPTDSATGPGMLGKGEADLSMWDVMNTIAQIDEGSPIVALAGVHAGCFELFGSDRVKTIRDLKGKTVAVTALRNADHMLIASMLGYVGLNPEKDVNWLPVGLKRAMELFLEGKSDAFMGFAPQPQELRMRKFGHVIVNTAQDRPWSQYFCCTISANRDFAMRNPVATKRALRAILKAADICSREPERVARYLAAKGYEPRYELGLEILKMLPYDRWRQANPEDTIRFQSLRLREAGLLKLDPAQIIAKGTDWRFLNELKKELKA